MKALIHSKYGPTKNLTIQEVDKPKVKNNEVLVKVKASSVNSWDWDLVSGTPYLYRLLFGLFKPKYPIIGIDIAGNVEDLGKNVTKFKIGDEVYGDISNSGFGAFAEYACTRENLLYHKPNTATFEQAATLPHAGVLAYQSILFNGRPTGNKKILINGAGGSTGPFAIQMAKQYNAEITCVDSADKFDFLKSLGADHIIDYKTTDFTQSNTKYDLIIDLVANKSISAYKNALTKNGACCIVGGSVKRLIHVALWNVFFGKSSTKKIGLLIHKPGFENLNKLNTLFDQGIINATIDKTYSFELIPEAIKKLSEGKLMGKAVIYIA